MAKKEKTIITLKTEIQIGSVTAGRTNPAPTDSLKPKVDVKPVDDKKDSK